ncbi:MAG: c-type cytochrome [Gallionellaceae bacterium]|jgi:mono/diheme cytochrome c family protein
MSNRLLAVFTLLTLATSVQAAPFAKGNAETGGKLMEQHQCNACHISKMGGDGSAIYTRADHKVKSPAALASQIKACSSNLGLMLFEDDEENIAAYLNNKYYKFK